MKPEKIMQVMVFRDGTVVVVNKQGEIVRRLNSNIKTIFAQWAEANDAKFAKGAELCFSADLKTRLKTL